MSKHTQAPAIERKARKLALEWINANRIADGKPPLKQVQKLWWEIHGNDWRGQARQSR